MIPQDQQHQTQWIRDRLQDLGWKIAQVEQPYEHEWWAAEIWIIESTWAKVGVRVYLTFLVDPMGDQAWAIGADTVRPTGPQSARKTERFGHGWEERMQIFLNSLSEFRDPKTIA